MSTYREIVDQVLDLASHQRGDDLETMIKDSVNRIYRRLQQWVQSSEQKREFTLTTRSDVSKYGMPMHVMRVVNIEDTANFKHIWETSAREFDIDHPGTTTTGPPVKVYPFGSFGVQRQPATALTLSITSSSALDTGSDFLLRVSGFVSGVVQTEQVTLTGTSAATTSNTYDANGVQRLVKELGAGASWTGTLTITDGTNTLAVIPPWQTSPTYQWVEIYPICDDAYSLTVRAAMYEPPLVNDGDWPEIDEDFHNLLVWGGAMEVLPTVGKGPEARQQTAKYLEGAKEFRGIQQVRPNRIRTFSDVTTRGYFPRRPLIKNVDIV